MARVRLNATKLSSSGRDPTTAGSAPVSGPNTPASSRAENASALSTLITARSPTLRLVTHLDLDDAGIERAIVAFSAFFSRA